MPYDPIDPSTSEARLAFVDAANADLRTEIAALRDTVRLVTGERDAAQQWYAVLDERVDDLTEQLATRTGRIDPTPGQVAAYVKATRALDDPQDWTTPDPAVVRAGLAAVQWALLNPTIVDGEVIAPGDRRPGDRVTLTGILGPYTEDSYGVKVKAWNGTEWLNEAEYTVTRPVPPLPTEPGTVVEATVRGRTVTLVLTDDPDPEYRWFVVAGHDPERRSRDRWIPVGDLTAVRVLSAPGATP